MGTIMIPKKCKVGFQNRKETFTGKLAYVIYYDEKNVLRKENSWNSWRDEKQEPLDFENTPTSGFFVNKKVGGNRYGWDYRQTYCRIYDPRGFEIEITISNLIYILKNTNSSKDKGFEGEFVYGWDGKELLLVPVEAPEYQEIKDKTSAVYDKGYIKGKDLIPGYNYSDLQDNQFVYLTKDFNYSYQKVFQRSYPYYHREKYNIPNMTEIEFEKLPFSAEDQKYKILIKKSSKKVFWFYDVKKNEIMFFGNLDKKIYNVLGKTPSENLSDYYNMLYRNNEYSKIIYEKDKLVYYTLEEFANKITPPINKKNAWIYFYSLDNNNTTNSIYKKRKHEIWLQEDKFRVDFIEKSWEHDFQYFSYTAENIEFVYNIIKPIKSNIHTLENGYTYEDFL